MTGEPEGFARLHPDVQHLIVNELQWPGLRPVQEQTIGPVLAGDNCVVLAPTAGGKTEAAFFPVMTRLLEEGWEGLSILYLSPIKALLNNQAERLEGLMKLIGHEVGVWHGDIADSKKRRMRREPPSLMLTTPESLEGMLMSTKTSSETMFGNLRVVVIDEVHAFAGDDRGWHLLGVLERLSRHAGRDIQRLGLSATVGNPEEISAWLGGRSSRRATTVDPGGGGDEPDITVDFVGSLRNAARVIAALHKGEKRLVFCDSRIGVEKLAKALRDYDVRAFVHHGSLSADERKLTEREFHEGGAGVICATSALELGIDIGSLDRVIQIGSPMTVASFLQRMGRTGRRAGVRRNCLFLALDDRDLWQTMALLHLWRMGYVEPAEAPGVPYHILAQQMLATALEEPAIAKDTMLKLQTGFCEMASIPTKAAARELEHLLRSGFLFEQVGRIAMGLEGEETFGRRNYLELVSVFTAPPSFRVFWGAREIGEVDQATFLEDNEAGPKVILLAGRSWLVNSVDWKRRRAYVEPFERAGKSQWSGEAPPMLRPMAQAHLTVINADNLGEEYCSERARTELESIRNEFEFVSPEGTSVVRLSGKAEVWTFGGSYTNRRLVELFRSTGLKASSDALRVAIGDSVLLRELESVLSMSGEFRPVVDAEHPYLRNLKFSELLPGRMLAEAGEARFYGTSEDADVPGPVVYLDYSL